MEKLERPGYPTVNKVSGYDYSFWHNTRTWQTAGRTDRRTRQNVIKFVRSGLGIYDSVVWYSSDGSILQWAHTLVSRILQQPGGEEVVVWARMWFICKAKYSKFCKDQSLLSHVTLLQTDAQKGIRRAVLRLLNSPLVIICHLLFFNIILWECAFYKL